MSVTALLIYTCSGLRSLSLPRQDRPPAELADRKARELYVGNLTIGCVTGQMLTELFTYPLQKLPLGDKATGVATPVVEAKVDASGKYAFVLFADDQLATMVPRLRRRTLPLSAPVVSVISLPLSSLLSSGSALRVPGPRDLQ